MAGLEKVNLPAEPVARGILPSRKQSFCDLFIWKQRVEITNSNGETNTEWRSPEPLKKPISLFMQLSARDWLFFVMGFVAWTADAFDFHALSIQTVKLAEYYGESKSNITTAITLTLLLRSIGAALFGLAGDRFGRKWPMAVNMIILGALQIATIYSSTFQQFLGVRSLFGLFMGGVYGNAIAMALEHCPTNARGLMSGILQQGCSFGYVIAACANLGVGGSTGSWKTVFWIGTGLSSASESSESSSPNPSNSLQRRRQALNTTPNRVLSRPKSRQCLPTNGRLSSIASSSCLGLTTTATRLRTVTLPSCEPKRDSIMHRLVVLVSS
jgi:MFS family permease